MPQGSEDLLIFLAVGTQLNAVLLGDDQRHLQDVDGVEPQPLAVQGRFGIDVLGQDLKVQGLHEQGGNFPLQTDIGQRRRLLHERRFVGHRLGIR